MEETLSHLSTEVVGSASVLQHDFLSTYYASSVPGGSLGPEVTREALCVVLTHGRGFLSRRVPWVRAVTSCLWVPRGA